MSKTFKEYYEDDALRLKKNKKKLHKDTRKTVKNYLKIENLSSIDHLDLEEIQDEIT
jgi:hypothetical protein